MKIAFGAAPKRHIAAILHSFEKRRERVPSECACPSCKIFEWPQAIKKGIAHDAAQTLLVMRLKHKTSG